MHTYVHVHVHVGVDCMNCIHYQTTNESTTHDEKLTIADWTNQVICHQIKSPSVNLRSVSVST